MSTQDRKARERHNRRKAIMNAAYKIIGAHGLAGLSIELIAQETELAKGTIYIYFANKEEIISSVTTLARHKMLKIFVKVSKSEISPIEKVERIISDYYSFYKKNPVDYTLMSLYEADPSLVETTEMMDTSATITQVVNNIIQEGQRDGTINNSINALHFTMILWATITGLLQLIKVRGTLLQQHFNLKEKELIDSFISILMSGAKNK